ncbi:hypothetical protein, variant [Spizellomyces punctatus DAOM BR117]|uniref:EF-hand domain-containing protein n=1 Tax=Spizellomyces punctatus (strain DAOM BR117) TaxID=645134 RepID=A0A0L0H7B7_SPIPD|nr:hypothetical protein, variant [Spizellomyces punctatus DAOM BR117]KNC97107.1 hypothetical protein, variant [Spizellomyces punctatus DAOM BR117]|eukprot:XP_016605147.1 hypothetical protein, variant [Spizellomyces punctatus DAOM BR117]
MPSPFSGGLTAIKPDTSQPHVAASAEADECIIPAKSPHRPRRKVKRDVIPCVEVVGEGKRWEVEKREIVESTTVFSKTMPRFPFPPLISGAHQERHREILTQIRTLFTDPTQTLSEHDFIAVTRMCGIPRYINRALFMRCGGEVDGVGVCFEGFERFWRRLLNCPTTHETVFAILRKEGNSLSEDDFRVVVQDVCAHHPGLVFLRDMPVFQTRYVDTVVTRIFYDKTRNIVPRMTFKEFKKDGVMELVQGLEKEDDINMTRNAFSYKHFYVIYCKFWELDTDHDLHISFSSLSTYENSCLSAPILRRVFSGAGRGQHLQNDLMTYRDFIWFILAVEDKASRAGMEYWFRCLDIDGDGVISLWELQEFFGEQARRMEEWRMSDLWKWGDFLCAVLDMINPKDPTRISLHDLRRSNNAALIFDMLFDIRKYDLHLRRIDPGFREWDDVFGVDDSGDRVKLEGWDKYAERAYDELAFDESHNESSNFSSGRFYMDDTELWEDDDDVDLARDTRLEDEDRQEESPEERGTSPEPMILDENDEEETAVPEEV